MTEYAYEVVVAGRLGPLMCGVLAGGPVDWATPVTVVRFEAASGASTPLLRTLWEPVDERELRFLDTRENTT